MTDTSAQHIRLAEGTAEIGAVVEVFADIWGVVEMRPNLLRAIQHAGGYVAVVEDDAAGIVGASVGFLGVHDGRPSLHSHITGVRDDHRGVGTALKHHQRDWAAANGLAVITWTFDPLVARNCWMNLHKLRATGAAYLPDHYGVMDDAVNRGVSTDRLLAVWPIAPTDPVRREGLREQPTTDGQPVQAAEPVVILDRDDRGAPRGASDPSSAGGRPLLVRLPTDVEALRPADPTMARRWRTATRTVMMAAYEHGYAATDAVRDGGLILTAPSRGVAPPERAEATP